MLFDPHKEQWWNAPNKREAYYMTLRIHYGMGALEAWTYLKRAWADYPQFMKQPIQTLREALRNA